MGKPRRLALPGRTVGLRFTLLYAVVFLLSGIVLLALTYLLSGGKVTSVAPGQNPPGQQPSLAAAQQRIQRLEAQLTDVEAAQSRRMLMGSLTALVVMAVASTLLGRVIAGRVLRPLRTITAATRRITAESLHERLSVPGPADEVKDLADTIDDLLERLEAAFAAQRRFVANASHELRTPLTTMRASLDVAMAKPEPVPPQTVALAGRLRTELDRVDRLLEGFLLLARAQHGALADRAPVSLGRLAGEALTARAADVAAKNLTLDDRDLHATVWTEGSSTLLARMVQNLIDNAVVHNSDGGWIRVATAADDDTARLVVETGGPVLHQDQVARLARPFQRLGADRTGSDDGSGLGLSIVLAIAAAHGGRLDLHARREGGLRVTVALPLAASREGVKA
jgi:signal transduction histidine kinase